MIIWLLLGLIGLLWLIIEHLQTGQNITPITINDLPIIFLVISLGLISFLYMLIDYLHRKGKI